MAKIFCTLFLLGIIFAGEENEHDTNHKLERLAIANHPENLQRDLVLSPFPEHPCPPIYVLTFPNGAEMLCVGTTHIVPLHLIISYRLAMEAIGQAEFVVEEVNGEVLPGELDTTGKQELNFYMTQDRKNKIRDNIRKYLEKWNPYNGNRKLEEDLEKQYSEVFDENGSWYKKAGIIAPADAKVDLDSRELMQKQLSDVTKVVIHNKIVEVPSDKELHPYALEDLYKCIIGTPLYREPSCGGVDAHLLKIASDFGKRIYALEKMDDRFGDGFKQEYMNEIDNNSYASDFPVSYYTEFFADLKKPDLRHAAKLLSEEPTFASIEPSILLYSGDLPKNNGLNLIERNTLWIKKLLGLKGDKFKRAFVYVGEGHFSNLFQQLKSTNFKVSERVSLTKLEEWLLNENGLIAEHNRRKACMRKAFGAKEESYSQALSHQFTKSEQANDLITKQILSWCKACYSAICKASLERFYDASTYCHTA